MLHLFVNDLLIIIKYKFSGYCYYKQKLLSLGLVPGVIFKIKRIAPLGDPIEIFFKNTTLSLRKSELSIIDFKKVCHLDE